MELTRWQNVLLGFGCGVVIAGYFLLMVGMPLKAPSEAAHQARQEALEIAGLFPTGGYIRAVQSERPYGPVRFVIEEEHGRATAEVLVTEKSQASEWLGGCERGNRVSLSVKEFPEVRWGEDTSSVDTLGFFLTPYCQEGVD